MAGQRSIEHRILWWYRFLLLAAVCAAALLGYLYGQVHERDHADGILSALPGAQDYRALTFYNGFSIVRANGSSMQPALARYNFLLVRHTRQIARGDILVSGRHGMHRVVGLPGETVWLTGGNVRVCSPRTGGIPYCRFLTEPWVHLRGTQHRDWGPLILRHDYATVPDNRRCCEWLIDVPGDDVIGVAAGSLLSYGPLGPPENNYAKPLAPTLVYQR